LASQTVANLYGDMGQNIRIWPAESINMVSKNTPILVGVSQMTIKDTRIGAADAPSPQMLRLKAALDALNDSGVSEKLVRQIDRVVVVRTMADSVPSKPQPFGNSRAPAATLAHQCGIQDTKTIYSAVGGDQPQSLVNESAEAIYNGEARAILLAGAEATATFKAAMKQNASLDWSYSVGTDDDRGMGDRLLSKYEAKNGLGTPTTTYPAFEHALRHRWHRSRAEHAEAMAHLWSAFSAIAAANPYAQYPMERSADFLITPSDENYPIADPYLKWHVAQDAVNQSAAIVMTSVGEATNMGIAPEKWVFLHGYAKATDYTPSERPDLSRSQAIEDVLAACLEAACKTVDQISYLDLYSCFPCAVLLAAEALGIDSLSRPLTITGGLPFFGGAGNNYSMHAIVSMAEELRKNRNGYGLILANGGFLSKQAAGVYSAEPAENWRPCDSTNLQAKLDARPRPVLLSENCTARIDSYSILYSKGIATNGYVIGSTEQGRVLARVRPDDAKLLSVMQKCDPVGRMVKIAHLEGINYAMEIAEA
jgi:acetyl-CoA C-acetyltransferase